PRWHDIRAIERARGVSHRPSPFAQSAWRSNGVPFPFLRSVLLPARRHTDLGIVPDRFSAPPQIPAALLSTDPVSAANRPVVREPGQARRARQDACPEYPPHPPCVVTDLLPPPFCLRHMPPRLMLPAFAGRAVF